MVNNITIVRLRTNKKVDLKFSTVNMKRETLIFQETFVLFLFFHSHVEKRSTLGQVLTLS